MIMLVVMPSPLTWSAREFHLQLGEEKGLHTNEKNDILGLPLFGNRADDPVGGCCFTIIVCQSERVLARLGKADTAVDFGGNVDKGAIASVLGIEVLEPRERPCLDRRRLDTEELLDRLWLGTLLGDGGREGIIGFTIIEGFRPVDRRVYLEADVKVLAGKEILLVRRDDTAQSWACSQSLVCLSRCQSQRGRSNSEMLGQHGDVYE